MEKATRYASLDAFRGLTIALMILVNTPGSWAHVYAPLKHAAWHGCTPADLVFPFFLLSIGLSMSFSFRKFGYRISPEAAKKVLRRTLMLFLIGLLLNAYPFNRDYSTLRVMGVLQRIALAYGAAAFAAFYLNPKKIAIASGAVLVGYWLILLVFAPGDPYGPGTNLVRRIDLWLFGAGHLWQGIGIPFDPEGILSTLPAGVTVLIGYLAGRGILAGDSPAAAVQRCLRWALLLVPAGLVWALLFPINKSLWTSSYVLFTAGLGLLLLAALIWLLDVRNLKRWSFPLIVFGMNALFVYVLSSLWVKTLVYLIRIGDTEGRAVTGYSWLYNRLFVPALGDDIGSLLFALAHIAFYWLLLLILYRRNIFIKL